ncbi:MAG: hypothetical protein IKD00_05945 [Candidatus Methanomethylophilaceae archaeon]|nr:hypothetical protein [Candidatus Methanomethylophilaceae archaeon]
MTDTTGTNGTNGTVTSFKRPQYECRVCSYMWMGRRVKSGGNEFSKPRLCPNCHSALWNRDDVKVVECKRCGHQWTTAGDPERCPHCRTHKWDMEKEICTCNFCGYSWERKCEATPRACPSCKRGVWNHPTTLHECNRCGLEYQARYNTLNKCPDCGMPAYFYVCGSCGHRWFSEVYHRQCPECLSQIRAKNNGGRKFHDVSNAGDGMEEILVEILKKEDNLVKIASELGIPYSRVQEVQRSLQANGIL